MCVLIDLGGEMILDEFVEVWMLGCCCDLVFWLLFFFVYNCFWGCVVIEVNVVFNLRCGLEFFVGLGFFVIIGNGISWIVCC